jgi:hypothetical protein
MPTHLIFLHLISLIILNEEYIIERIIMKILIMQSPPTSCHFLRLRSEITIFSNKISLCSFLNGDTHSYHCALKGQNGALFIRPWILQFAIDFGTPMPFFLSWLWRIAYSVWSPRGAMTSFHLDSQVALYRFGHRSGITLTVMYDMSLAMFSSLQFGRKTQEGPGP